MLVRVAALLVLASPLFVRAAQEGAFTGKPSMTPPPKELSDEVRQLLAPKSVQLMEGDKQIGEFWFRDQIPAQATPEQLKNGITWKEVPQTSVIGVVRFDQDWSDYRRQKVKAGVYTLRLGYQPADGDHQGSSDYQDFLVVIAADKDKKPELLDVKHMVELSGSSIGATHPGVFMLSPNPKEAGPRVVAAPKDHWVLQTKREVAVQGKKTGTELGIGLNVVGHAE